jgi:UDP-N-acetylglucosamine acyltransferase
VRIAGGTFVGPHVVIGGRTTIGRGNRVFPFCSIGGAPQDKKYGGEDTELLIGEGNTIRESCTISIGTAQGGGITRIGSDNWIMAYVHIAHDCRVGDHTILANNATLAGHVTLGDWAIIGGMSAMHQFCSMGPHAMAGGGSIILRDIPPFVICNGNPAEPHGINTEGLKRRGFEAETINLLRRAYKALYRDGLTTAEAVSALTRLATENSAAADAIGVLRDFVRDSQRGIIR